MSEILRSTHEGVLKLGKINIECHVLEDKSRIFSSRDLLKAFNLQTEQKDQPRILRGFLSKIKLISLSDKDLTNPLILPSQPSQYHPHLDKIYSCCNCAKIPKT